MTQVEQRIINGLEMILYARHDEQFLRYAFKDVGEKEKEAFSDIFAAGFMFASVHAFGKMQPSSYADLVAQSKIPIDERLKVLIAYMKSKADE